MLNTSKHAIALYYTLSGFSKPVCPLFWVSSFDNPEPDARLCIDACE